MFIRSNAYRKALRARLASYEPNSDHATEVLAEGSASEIASTLSGRALS